MPSARTASKKVRYIVVVLYGSVLLAMIMLAVANYPVQWKHQTNLERATYLKILIQAMDYYYLDHGSELPNLPQGSRAIATESSCRVYCTALKQTIPCVDLDQILVPAYTKGIPRDSMLPRTRSGVSGFYLVRDGQRVRMGACDTFFDQEVWLERDYSRGVPRNF